MATVGLTCLVAPGGVGWARSGPESYVGPGEQVEPARLACEACAAGLGPLAVGRRAQALFTRISVLGLWDL